MPKPKSNMREIDDISYALCEWFKSQGVPTGQAVAAMGLTIVIIAAEGSEDVEGIMDKLDMVSDNMRRTVMHVIDVKGRG